MQILINPSLLLCNYQMSVALPGSSRDVYVYISASNKIAATDFVKESTASYIEVAQVQGVSMTIVRFSIFIVKQKLPSQMLL